jgi:hypothetical protein
MMCALSSIFTFIPFIFLFSLSNRLIGFNLRQIQDIDYSNIYKIEGAIIFLDFSKGFDSLEWDFMFSTLKHYGFNYSFVTNLS